MKKSKDYSKIGTLDELSRFLDQKVMVYDVHGRIRFAARIRHFKKQSYSVLEALGGFRAEILYEHRLKDFLFKTFE